MGKDSAGPTEISIYILPKAAPRRHSFNEKEAALCHKTSDSAPCHFATSLGIKMSLQIRIHPKAPEEGQ